MSFDYPSTTLRLRFGYAQGAAQEAKFSAPQGARNAEGIETIGQNGEQPNSLKDCKPVSL